MTDARIRVAHCLEQVRSGGVERRRLSLARRLDPNRFEQLLLCTEASTELRSQFEQAGCQVVELGPMKRGVDWRHLRRAAQALREFRPDIVHGAVFEGVIVAAIAGRLARAPVIVAEETIVPVGRRWTGHLYFRFLMGLADHIVAISQGVSNYLTKIRVPRSKIQLIYNGVAEPPPASSEVLHAVRASLGLAAGAPVVGTVARLGASRGQNPDAHKRISDAIAAMRYVIEVHPNARLVIVGDGPARQFLEQRAAAEGLQAAIIFAGFQPRVRPFHEIFDVIVHPSETEGLPLALVEAMLAARPIVATDVPGTNEVVADEETGFLVPVGEPAELAGRAIQLLGDSALRRTMGEAGLRRARSLFSEDRYVREIAAMYEELVGSRAGRSNA